MRENQVECEKKREPAIAKRATITQFIPNVDARGKKAQGGKDTR